MLNEYRLYNGSPVDINIDTFRAISKDGKLFIPSVLEIVQFDNIARFLADVVAVHNEEGEEIIISINYGSCLDLLSERDTYFQYYNSFLHKNYPLIVNGQLLQSKGKAELVISREEIDDRPYNNITGIRDLGISMETNDMRNPAHRVEVKVIPHNEIEKYVTIKELKSNQLGQITEMNLAGYSEEEKDLLRKAGLLDECYAMYEVWNNPEDISDDYRKKANDDIALKGEGELPLSFGEEALTGYTRIYELEIDCSQFRIDREHVVLFDEIFRDKIDLSDFKEYMENIADYIEDSVIIKKVSDKTFNIGTSLALTSIEPDENGKIKLKVVNKLINDIGTDYGWYV